LLENLHMIKVWTHGTLAVSRSDRKGTMLVIFYTTSNLMYKA